MEYTNAFYEQYENYLLEDSVRVAHDWVLRIAALDAAFQNVVDFGCGTSREFLVHAKPSKYVGIDLCDRADIQADYRTFDLARLPARPDAFVSLFSIEITEKDNYPFYEKVFHALPVKMGLVSGFYYAGCDEDAVDEAGGVRSYQTLEKIENVRSSVFSEKRIILPVPSTMFGKDVIEVWKLFTRT